VPCLRPTERKNNYIWYWVCISYSKCWKIFWLLWKRWNIYW